MNKKQLKEDLDKLFNDIPLDGNVLTVRQKLNNFIEDNILDYETANLDEPQTKYLLIEFE